MKIVAVVTTVLVDTWAIRKVWGIGQQNTDTSVQNFPTLFHHGSKAVGVGSVSSMIRALEEFFRELGVDITKSCLPSGCTDL